ncbi:hypothetical protein [Rhizobium sp. LCM 4573]|uniref:hypothetical protein n=1 Tax=Rhizobium sp. LCM 4573 TaxID=1848291 RepID=UPI0008DB11C3|nr:hypothetical protein [Rhizobium sp. LCM 4573]OHV78540.1 hypothetical protein LCM4573_26560 [Rhizobium sp. LCM 4573]
MLNIKTSLFVLSLFGAVVAGGGAGVVGTKVFSGDPVVCPPVVSEPAEGLNTFKRGVPVQNTGRDKGY